MDSYYKPEDLGKFAEIGKRALIHPFAIFALGDQPQTLDPHKFGDCKTVVNLCQIQILWSKPRHFKGLFSGNFFQLVPGYFTV